MNFILKILITQLFKWLKRYSDMKKLDKYVNKPNELDKQIKQNIKNTNKALKYIEELEKEVGSLKSKFRKIKFIK